MSKKEQTTQNILAVSKKLFIRNGFKNTLMLDIATLANIGRRTLYRYFESKDILLIAVVTDYYVKFNKTIGKIAFEKNCSGFDKVEILLYSYEEYFRSNQEMLSLISMVEKNLNNEIRSSEYYQSFVVEADIADNLLIKLLTDGVNDHSIVSTIDIRTSAVTINNSLLSLASRVIKDKTKANQNRNEQSWMLVRSLKDMLLRGIKND